MLPTLAADRGRVLQDNNDRTVNMEDRGEGGRGQSVYVIFLTLHLQPAGLPDWPGSLHQPSSAPHLLHLHD